MNEPLFTHALLASAAAVLVVMCATAAITRQSGKAAYVDAAWGASFVAAAWAPFASLLAHASSPSWRAWLLLALVTIWGLRLTWHLGRRVRHSRHDDPRYEEYLGGPIGSIPISRVLIRVFGLQTILVIAVATPVVCGVARPVSAVWPVVLGTLLWTVGVVFEAVADAQLAAYRAEPDRPGLLTTGLWSVSRHPNYFGDFCVWWGLWLIGGAASGPRTALLSLCAPVLMTWILIGVSGVRLAERRMRGRPGWAAYAAATPIFVPRPHLPRRSDRSC